VNYYYDVLVGLDVLTALGYGDDPRLGFALAHLSLNSRPYTGQVPPRTS
jgi:hypothetical protein